MIEIEGLVKDYGGKRALDGLNLSVGAGVFFTFLGPNGAGKTTTMKIMAGLLRPTAGAVRIDGIDVVRHPVAAKARIGYVPDHPFLYGKLSAWEFLDFVGGLYRMDTAAIRKRGGEILETFDLTGVADHLVDSFSHGMRQRLAFAACFLHEPRVVIIDEPWVGLDPRNIRTAIRFMQEQVKLGVTIFLSTHSLDLAQETADRIGILHHGRLLYDGSVQGLRAESETKDLEEIFLELTG
jgi:ABC-2 type transport system ATP-binding protein